MRVTTGACIFRCFFVFKGCHPLARHLVADASFRKKLVLVLVERSLTARLHLGADVSLGQSVGAAEAVLAETTVADEGRGAFRALGEEALAAAAQSQHQMERGFLLDVVVGESSTVLELLTGEDEALLVGRDAFLVLDFGLDVLDRVGRLDFERDRLTRKGLDEDLHTAAQSQHQMKRGLLLDVVVGEGTTVFELLAREDQALLVRRNAFFVLNLRFYVFDGVARLNLEGDGFASEGLYEDLHFL